MKIVIIDDEIDARKNLRIHIEKYMPEACVLEEADSVKSGVELLNNLQPDVVFLDIHMNDGSGFDLLDQLERINFFIIFVTAYDHHAIKAFKYAAIDYILKPIDVVDFKIAITKLKFKKSEKEFNAMYNLLKQMNKKKSFDKMAIPCKDGTVYLALNDIVNIQSSGSNTLLYTVEDEKIIAVRIIKEFEALLPSTSFFRTHQSHIVNIKHISKFHRLDESLIMKNGLEIPVARRRKDDLMAILK